MWQEAESDARRHERAAQQAVEDAAASARDAREAGMRAADAERQSLAARAEADKLTADLGMRCS